MIEHPKSIYLFIMTWTCCLSLCPKPSAAKEDLPPTRSHQVLDTFKELQRREASSVLKRPTENESKFPILYRANSARSPKAARKESLPQTRDISKHISVRKIENPHYATYKRSTGDTNSSDISPKIHDVELNNVGD
jgi:hypothetical protein